jgi:hypothetical protein
MAAGKLTLGATTPGTRAESEEPRHLASRYREMGGARSVATSSVLPSVWITNGRSSMPKCPAPP